MKFCMNFTTSPDDMKRYRDTEDLQDFYRRHHCDGLELMPINGGAPHLIRPDMVVGVHANCITDWMGMDMDRLVNHYRKDLRYAKKIHAKYVVFHVTQVAFGESLTYQMKHTDEEVIDAAARLINRLLDGADYDFYFLMENLWWPGLNFLCPKTTQALLDAIHYEKKGLMLDTGHFMNTNPKLRTQEEAESYLNSMLDAHESLLPMIKGIHLNRSLSGAYLEEYMKNPCTPSQDYNQLFCQAFEHIFKIDQHRPFDSPGVPGLIRRVAPEYVTLEYITKDREEHARYLRQGTKCLSEFL